jgi:hypothetical protein
VFHVLGRQVRNLVNDERQAGTHSVSFNGMDLSSGVYYYRLRTNDEVLTGRMILSK